MGGAADQHRKLSYPHAEPAPRRLSGTQVLAIRGCGFIGTNLALELPARGARVTVLDLPDTDWSRLPDDVVRVRADIMDRAALAGVCRGIEIVSHLAARTDLDGRTLQDYAVNFEGTRNVIDEAVASGSVRRFVFYSTILVVGIFDATRLVEEDEPFRTNTLYGQSKVEGEKLTLAMCGDAVLPCTIIGPASVYGPWGEEPYDAVFRSVKFRRYVHVGKADNLVLGLREEPRRPDDHRVGRGRRGRSDLLRHRPASVHDASDRRLRLRLLRGQDPEGAAPLLVAVAYLMGLLKSAGVPVPLYPSRLKNIRANYCFSMVKSAALGHVQRYDLGHGVRETLDWYEAHDLLG